jgi:hypothetical protein
VRHDLPGTEASVAGHALHEPGERVIGHREQKQVSVLDNGCDRLQRNSRQKVGCPAAAVVGQSVGRDDGVAGGAQGCRQDGTDAPGADHADPAARRWCWCRHVGMRGHQIQPFALQSQVGTGRLCCP